VVALVAVGVTAHSIAVLAEGTDYLLDAAGVGVALLAIDQAARPASRRPPSKPEPAPACSAIDQQFLRGRSASSPGTNARARRRGPTRETARDPPISSSNSPTVYAMASGHRKWFTARSGT
jgi:hypothetical protein